MDCACWLEQFLSQVGENPYPLIYGTKGAQQKYWCKQVEVICCVSPLDYGMYKTSFVGSLAGAGRCCARNWV